VLVPPLVVLSSLFRLLVDVVQEMSQPRMMIPIKVVSRLLVVHLVVLEAVAA
jgi:hypothetical protein